jgi:hypothetical protein
MLGLKWEYVVGEMRCFRVTRYLCTRGMVSLGRAVSGGHGDLQGRALPDRFR